ncbi:hypothetical protein Q7P37_004662 [Cladosporium fusiforme]
MAVSPIPAGGVSLRGPPLDMPTTKHDSRSAILFKLSQSMLNDLREASNGKDGLHFVTGKVPKLQLGNRSFDLDISPDVFRNELYTSTSPTDLAFDAVITHRATVAPLPSKQPDTAGADAALAALQNSMASYQQEKKAKSTLITDDVLPEYRNRFDAKKQKRGGLLGMSSGNSSPSLSAVGTPRAGLSTTSAPNDQTLRRQAMRTPLIHLLAMKPASTEEITKKTHIPKADLEDVVRKIAQPAEAKWKLADRAFKELDVYKFGYQTQEDRQMAIDNAIRAYDRLRIAKEDKLWQLLLPQEERGQGKVLSKLHLSAPPQTNRGSTPSYMPSPLPNASEDERPMSSANTPRPGQSGTPKPGVAKSTGSDMKKRLLAKDPKKARAAEEAKEKRKREREAAASDRDGRPAKKQKPTGTTNSTTVTTAKASSKIKSAELVHSSDDEDEEGEVKETPPAPAPKASQVTASTKVKPKAAAAPSPDSSDNQVKPVKAAARAVTTTKAKTSTPTTKSAPSPAIKQTKSAAPGGSTPSTTALPASSRQRTQLSPSKSHSRPTVPSPLGAARPRNASDVSERSAVGVQRPKQGGASTPKGLGITTGVNGVRKKRQDTVTSRDSFTSSDGDKKANATKPLNKDRTPNTNGVLSQRAPVATSVKPSAVTSTIKRKAEETLARNQSNPGLKHRKTDSTSSISQRSHSSSFGTVRTMTTASGNFPDAVFDSGSSDSSTSVVENITYQDGVEKAKKFRETFYPQYVKLYDSISERQNKGETIRQEERERLWKMHRRLEEMKREIAIAAKREVS